MPSSAVQDWLLCRSTNRKTADPASTAFESRQKKIASTESSTVLSTNAARRARTKATVFDVAHAQDPAREGARMTEWAVLVSV